MKGKIGTGTIVLIGAAVLLWTKRKEVAAAIKPGIGSAVTVSQAEAILAEPTKAAAALDSYIAVHPTSYSQIEQVKIQIAAGRASPGDVILFSAQFRAYDQYVSDGGTMSYDDFTGLSETRMKALAGEQYWAIIAAAKQERALLEAKPGEVVAAIEQSTVPEGFTASIKQLEELVAAGITKETEVYQHAMDLAYIEAAKTCRDGDIVTYSDDGGYESKSYDEIAAEASAAGPDAWMYYT